MTKTRYIIGSALGGVLVGSIGAAVASTTNNHPVLKGSLATGAIYAGLAALVVATDSIKFDPDPDTFSLSGSPQRLMFRGFP